VAWPAWRWLQILVALVVRHAMTLALSGVVAGTVAAVAAS